MPAAVAKKPKELSARLPEVNTPEDLGACITFAHEHIETFINELVAKTKLACPGLPSEVIKKDIVKGHCPCFAALRLIRESGATNG
jgi:hypothetical protein